MSTGAQAAGFALGGLLAAPLRAAAGDADVVEELARAACGEDDAEWETIDAKARSRYRRIARAVVRRLAEIGARGIAGAVAGALSREEETP